MLWKNDINRYLQSITMNDINVQSVLRYLKSKKMNNIDIVE